MGMQSFRGAGGSGVVVIPAALRRHEPATNRWLEAIPRRLERIPNRWLGRVCDRWIERFNGRWLSLPPPPA